MATNLTYKFAPEASHRRSVLVPIVVIFGVVAAALFSFIWIENDLGSLTPSFYLLPWALLTGICVLAPSAYLLYVGKFDLFHPLVFAAWAGVVAALVVAATGADLPRVAALLGSAAIGLLAAELLLHRSRRRLGGVNGDVMGALAEVTTAITLLGGAALVG